MTVGDVLFYPSIYFSRLLSTNSRLTFSIVTNTRLLYSSILPLYKLFWSRERLKQKRGKWIVSSHSDFLKSCKKDKQWTPPKKYFFMELKWCYTSPKYSAVFNAAPTLDWGIPDEWLCFRQDIVWSVVGGVWIVVEVRVSIFVARHNHTI